MNLILWERSPVKLSISRSELHIWRVDLNNVNHPFKDLSSLLSPEEIKRSERFVFERDRHRYQVTHRMKRLILANYLNCDPRCLRFEVGNHGKPALDNLRNPLKVQFNISPSRDLMFIAVRPRVAQE